ncbi:MAG: glycerophosphodiester phosphodiesterase [Actinomycetota bacterium]|nr:glycerophosphodiester phosphodiesterase [Actinomycetota bacterium]
MTRYLDSPTPRAFAHRGWHTGDLAGLENSMAAFGRALEEGYRYLETDVHTTKDGVLVAFHDAVLDRVSDGTGPIATQTWDQIRHARIGGREPIPLFAEVLANFPEAMVNVDPKSDAAVGPLIDVLADAGAQHRVCLGSFSGKRLAALRAALGPLVATSLAPGEVLPLVGPAAIFTGEKLSALGAVAAQVPVRYGLLPVVTRKFVERAHRSNLEVHVWTIDDPAEMHRLLDLGADAIMTDRPDVLREVYSERGVWR